ncbi:hypothetical protein THF5H11_130070 [Vibrio jasicida]|nr:hypothetical protein THF5H11_130070 [Vibrio jasicida]
MCLGISRNLRQAFENSTSTKVKVNVEETKLKTALLFLQSRLFLFY